MLINENFEVFNEQLNLAVRNSLNKQSLDKSMATNIELEQQGSLQNQLEETSANVLTTESDAF